MLYTGVTGHLVARVDQHRRDVGSDYCHKYGIRMLVFAEQYESITDAITREKRLKAWKREWKVRLIESINPEWRDLWDQLA